MQRLALFATLGRIPISAHAAYPAALDAFTRLLPPNPGNPTATVRFK